MAPGFYRLWFRRGLRVALVIGVIAAGWHSWTVLDRYLDDQNALAKSELTYRCAARLSEDVLASRMNEFGNINVRDVCFTDRDFYVAKYELEAVRAGTMKFETAWKPVDWQGALIVGAIWAMSAVLLTLGLLGAIFVGRWVWGRPQ